LKHSAVWRCRSIYLYITSGTAATIPQAPLDFAF
jgi:hypothetical protein